MSTDLNRDALVVGICQYDDPSLNSEQLKALAMQAEQLAQLLETKGDFKVKRLPCTAEICLDLKERIEIGDLEKAIDQLFNPPNQSVTQTALLFFAGHGLLKETRVSREGFLATSEADNKSVYGVSYQWLAKILCNSPIKQQIVFIEACHSGAFLEAIEEEQKKGCFKSKDICFITSSRAHEEALANGLLTQDLLDILKNQNITTHLLIKELQNKEKQPNRGSQRFQIKTHGKSIALISELKIKKDFFKKTTLMSRISAVFMIVVLVATLTVSVSWLYQQYRIKQEEVAKQLKDMKDIADKLVKDTEELAKHKAGELVKQKQAEFAEAKRKEEEFARLKHEEEKRKLTKIEQQKKDEEEKEQAKLAEAKRKEEERKLAEIEQQKKDEEEKKQAELAEAKRREEELARLKIDEERKLAEIEQQKKAEEEKKQAELAEAKRKEEEKKQAELAEAKRKEEEKKQAELAEAKRKEEELARLKTDEENDILALLKEEVELTNYDNWQKLKTFSGHVTEVYSVAFSPDGKTALSGGEDYTLILWNIATGKKLKTLKGHSYHVHSVAFSPDGKTALSGGGEKDKTLKLWDITSGKELKSFIGHSNAVKTVAFSPDGKTALSGSTDNTIKLWDIASGKELKTISGYGNVHRVEFSPDGKIALSGGNTLTLWDIAMGKPLKTFDWHSGWVTPMAFSPDGKTALLRGGYPDNTSKLWDITTGKELKTFAGDSYSAAFSPDGKTVLLGSYTELKLWNIATGKELKTFTIRGGEAGSLVFSPDGKTALSGGYRKLILWGAP